MKPFRLSPLKRTLLLFSGLGVLCLLLADLEITHVDPYLEMARLSKGLITPEVGVLWQLRDALLLTVIFAFCGVGLAVVGGALLASLYRFTLVRLFCACIRAIHEIFWAFLLMPVLGLNPICGVVAIAVPYAGIFAKVYAEILQETDQAPLAAFPSGAGLLERFSYGIWPLIYPAVRAYTSYRFECGLRSAAVLGFIGLPTLGYHLETFFREGQYSEAAALLFAFYLLIISLKYWLKPKVVAPLLALSFLLLPKNWSFSVENLVRVFSYDILPWPMRRQGFHDGSGDIHIPWDALWQWFTQLWQEQIWPGSIQTLILAQLALTASGLLALILVYNGCRHIHGPMITRPISLANIVLRTTPEYILAYLFLQLLGPSMLPAALAISLHNGAILGYLSRRQADGLPMPIDNPPRRTDRFFFWILPRIDGHFLAFLFYRWEVMMRESAILGILGLTTLGFYVDSAMAEDRMDRALLLIIFTAILNIGIDAVSTSVRRYLGVRTDLTINRAHP